MTFRYLLHLEQQARGKGERRGPARNDLVCQCSHCNAPATPAPQGSRGYHALITWLIIH